MCKFCESANYKEISITQKYSGIEVCIDKFGDLRVRTDNKDVAEDVAEQINKDIIKWYDIDYDPPVLNILNSEDIVRIRYCPMCGRKFDN